MLKRWWVTGKRAVQIFLEIGGDQRAAAFSFYAVFSLCPLLLLVISIGSQFVDPTQVSDIVVKYLDSYVPLQEENQIELNEILLGLFENRVSLSWLAIIGLFWSAGKFFQALVHGVNRAWHSEELVWWKVPLKNFLLLLALCLGLLLGVIVPAVLSAIEKIAPGNFGLLPFVIDLGRYLVPSIALIFGLTVLYYVSPRHRPPLSVIWKPVLLVTLGLKLLQSGLIYYTTNIWKVSAVYGALGMLVILLLWIHLCGSMVIFGACLCAASKENQE